MMNGETPAKAARHKHWFHAFPTRFGLYGPQDCHYHVCCAGGPNTDCARVLMADSRDCDGKPESHYRKTLS